MFELRFKFQMPALNTLGGVAETRTVLKVCRTYVSKAFDNSVVALVTDL